MSGIEQDCEIERIFLRVFLCGIHCGLWIGVDKVEIKIPGRVFLSDPGDFRGVGVRDWAIAESEDVDHSLGFWR